VNTTEVTVVGNLVGSPTQRRAGESTVVKMRLAATERRYDTRQGGFVDGPTLFVDVDCWADLGGNVIRSVAKGDQVIVKGNLYTDEWDSDAGRRQSTKIRAVAVGLNLTRGYCSFTRAPSAARPEGTTTPGSGETVAPPEVPGGTLLAAGDHPEGLAGGDYPEDLPALDPVDSEQPSPEASFV
jgi:single-strand DNA-binding protein